MFKSDANRHQISSNPDGNMHQISIEVITEVEKELLDSPYDMTSLVFLLYDVPDTALQRLLVYQRVSKDVYATNLNLLHEWMLGAKSKPIWREEFLEALLICQLFGIVKKLGFDIQSLKRQYQPENINFSRYVNRTKKTLYKLCENMNISNLNILKKTLHSYDIDTSEYEACELVFLKLMSEKIIALPEFGLDNTSLGYKFNFHKLVKLIQKLPGLEPFANDLWMIGKRNSEDIPDIIDQPVAASSPSINHASDISMTAPKPKNMQQHYNNHEFESLFDMLGDLNIDEIDMKSDSTMIGKDSYQIKDPNNIGVCLIINQEVFHFCDQSIEDANLKALQRRHGSSNDKIELQETMTQMNFKVITRDNLNHDEMIDFIKASIKKHVNNSTSIFMLCLLSHGVRNHIYAADSMKVNIEDIQNLLDADDVLCLSGIPKVLIIQACQSDDTPEPRFVADSPSSNNFRLRKKDFLVYWATSPEFEAYRSEKAGSIFIQFLCKVIRKYWKQEHLGDIFIKVNRVVTDFCMKNEVLQTPVLNNALVNKLYLYPPK